MLVIFEVNDASKLVAFVDTALVILDTTVVVTELFEEAVFSIPFFVDFEDSAVVLVLTPFFSLCLPFIKSFNEYLSISSSSSSEFPPLLLSRSSSSSSITSTMPIPLLLPSKH